MARRRTQQGESGSHFLDSRNMLGFVQRIPFLLETGRESSMICATFVFSSRTQSDSLISLYTVSAVADTPIDIVIVRLCFWSNC